MLLLTLPLLAAVRFNKSSGAASAEVGLSMCVMTLPICWAQQRSSRERKGQGMCTGGPGIVAGTECKSHHLPTNGKVTCHIPPSPSLTPNPSRCKHMCSVAKLCLTLCDPMDCGPPGSSVHGILQARILVWVAVPSSRGSSLPRIEPVALMSPALAGGVFTTNATWGRLPLVSGKLHTSRPSP